jgi:hypothetical protein
MAITTAQLLTAIPASATTFNLTNIVGSALPTAGAPALPMGVPMLIDAEFMFCIAQPVAGTVVVRMRGSDGTAAAPHDVLANVYASIVPSDFGAPQAGTETTLDPAEDAPISIGQDSTLVLTGANAVYNINKATAAAVVLPAPSLADNGVTLVFTSNTAAAHVVTSTGFYQDGTSGTPKSTATFAVFKGAAFTVVAENGFWNVTSLQNVTMA